VVLRSTVLPEYLTRLDFDIYLPEFVHERAAVSECVIPQYLVVGKKKADSRVPAFIETWRQRSVKHIECNAEDASYIKYLSNL
jgi:UDP-glucose 6-dehydrogenase